MFSFIGNAMTINDLNKPPLRSQPTRDRILEAAKLIFGRDGYDHATIRAIAAEAAINPAMVMRYYGNKDALFAAVTDFKPDVSALAQVPRSRLGETIVRRMLDTWDSPETGPGRRAMLLSALTNETARIKFSGQFINVYAKMLAADGAAKNSEVVIALIATQVIGLLVTRYLLVAPSVTSLSREQLIREVGRTLQNYIRIMDRPPSEERGE
jgi:AcrR family transcriptional regulator